MALTDYARKRFSSIQYVTYFKGVCMEYYQVAHIEKPAKPSFMYLSVQKKTILRF